jgi:hypothetical protein
VSDGAEIAMALGQAAVRIFVRISAERSRHRPGDTCYRQ